MRRLLRLLLASALAPLFVAPPTLATVTVTTCSGNPHCFVWNKRTVINVLTDTLVIDGPIVPLPGTSRFRITARAIIVDGASGGQVLASGTGKAIEMEALTSIVVSGNLLSSNTNGKILVKGTDFVQVQDSATINSGGYLRIGCIGQNCTVTFTGAHLRGNRVYLTALGDLIWDGSEVEAFGPRDLVFVSAAKGSIRKSGALAVALGGAERPDARAVALADGQLAPEVAAARAAASAGRKVSAVSEAEDFCPSCQETTPVPTPTPAGTASLPLGTPSPTVPGPTPTGSTPTSTAPTPTGPTPAGTPTPPCTNCITGGNESSLIMTAGTAIDASGQHYSVGRMITLKAGGNVDLTGSELRNDFGKCGEITVQAGGQIKVEGATLIDDDCKNQPDVSTLNGRSQLPHTGFGNVAGTPALDD